MSRRRLALILLGLTAAATAALVVYHQNGPNTGLLGRFGIPLPKK